ncbi:MAG: hypothetical protein HYU64_00990 [Armatimonadetes bacterium]|nr:hypothetical protein [Armatimonadota bacterium]
MELTKVKPDFSIESDPMRRPLLSRVCRVLLHLRPRRSVALLVLILSLAFVSCDLRPPRDVLALALLADPITLNPILAFEGPSQTVNSFIFSTLVRFNEKGEIVGDLAKSWDPSPDGKRWTFHLREGASWHDGHPFAADDVVFTYETMLHPTTNCYNRGLLQVAGKEVEFSSPDPHTVTAVLQAPFAPFLANLAVIGIVPKHLLEGQDVNRSSFNASPIGTGPFRFVRWRASDHILLSWNPDYYNGAPRVKSILFRIVPEGEARMIALETGQIDSGAISAKDYPRLAQNGRFQLFSWFDYIYYFMAFDLSNPLFEDIRVRRAMAHAVDRKHIVETVLPGMGRVANGPIPPASEYHTEDVETYPYDPTEASRLLSEAGWTRNRHGYLERGGEPFSFTLLFSQSAAPCEKAAVFIQSYLRNIGIRVKLRGMDFSVLVKTANPGDFQALILDWIEGPEFDYYTEWDSSQIGKEGMNFMAYRNPRTDALLRKARTTLRKDVRLALYRDFQRQVATDAPYLFLWYQKSAVAVSPRVRGLAPPGPWGLFLYPERLELRP